MGWRTPQRRIGPVPLAVSGALLNHTWAIGGSWRHTDQVFASTKHFWLRQDGYDDEWSEVGWPDLGVVSGHEVCIYSFFSLSYHV